jgi:hypothetical protein
MNEKLKISSKYSKLGRIVFGKFLIEEVPPDLEDAVDPHKIEDTETTLELQNKNRLLITHICSSQMGIFKNKIPL